MKDMIEDADVECMDIGDFLENYMKILVNNEDESVHIWNYIGPGQIGDDKGKYLEQAFTKDAAKRYALTILKAIGYGWIGETIIS